MEPWKLAAFVVVAEDGGIPPHHGGCTSASPCYRKPPTRVNASSVSSYRIHSDRHRIEVST